MTCGATVGSFLAYWEQAGPPETVLQANRNMRSQRWLFVRLIGTFGATKDCASG